MLTSIHQLVGCVCLPVGLHQPSCTYDSGILTSETSDFTVLVMWLYNSPELKPVDYNIWGCMQECRYKNPCVLCNLVQLKQWPVVIWADFIQTTVDKVTDQERKRFWAYSNVKVQHFRHLLRLVMRALFGKTCCFKQLTFQLTLQSILWLTHHEGFYGNGLNWYPTMNTSTYNVLIY